jgi:hypothetical protein
LTTLPLVNTHSSTCAITPPYRRWLHTYSALPRTVVNTSDTLTGVSHRDNRICNCVSFPHRPCCAAFAKRLQRVESQTVKKAKRRRQQQQHYPNWELEHLILEGTRSRYLLIAKGKLYCARKRFWKIPIYLYLKVMRLHI